jgi:hypothetical protein
MKLTSNFTLVDVQRGRAELAKHFEVGGPSIPITITGYIDGIWGHDDGVSQEFQMAVKTMAFGLTHGMTPADEEDGP